jgi:hypothetical protein
MEWGEMGCGMDGRSGVEGRGVGRVRQVRGESESESESEEEEEEEIRAGALVERFAASGIDDGVSVILTVLFVFPGSRQNSMGNGEWKA